MIQIHYLHKIIIFFKKWHLSILILPIFVAAFAYSHDVPDIQWKTEKTTLVSILEKEISLKPNTRYRGSVATFTGYNDVPSVTWLDQHTYDYHLMKSVGNAHRLVGLWKYNIPTLIEYSSLISPFSYLMASRLLMRPSDKQLRSITVYSKLNLNYLKSLGVRFLITDFSLIGKISLKTQKIFLRRTLTSKNVNLYLYELKNANLGHYSPTVERLANNINDIFKYMAQIDRNEFDFENEFVIDKTISHELVKASSSQLFVNQEGMTVKAQSKGTSIILLPLQFSRCLQLQSNSKSPLPTLTPRIMRVNIMQTGLLFTGIIEAKLQYKYGPFHNSFCRIKDYQDMKKLDISRVTLLEHHK